MRWWSKLLSINQTCWFCQSPAKFYGMNYIWNQTCEHCRQRWRRIVDTICEVCGRALPATEICSDCLQVEERDRVLNRSCVEYNDWAKEVIARWKFYGDELLEKPIACWMNEVIRKFSIRGSLITYVPVHEQRYRERGFNQAERLAVQLGGQLHLPVVGLIRRIKNTDAQSKRSRYQRLEALQGAFGLTEGLDLSKYIGQHVYLIDDVYTTGATVRECGKVLRANGITPISITFAR